MKDIYISVADKIARQVGTEVIVCGNKGDNGYNINFTFDEEWSSQATKTVRFAFWKDGENRHIDQVFSGTTVAVPELSNITLVFVGVFAGDLITTTPARILCKKSILCSGGTPEEPPEDVYNQIMALLNQGGAGGVTEE